MLYVGPSLLLIKEKITLWDLGQMFLKKDLMWMYYVAGNAFGAYSRQLLRKQHVLSHRNTESIAMGHRIRKKTNDKNSEIPWP